MLLLNLSVWNMRHMQIPICWSNYLENTIFQPITCVVDFYTNSIVNPLYRLIHRWSQYDKFQVSDQ